VSINVPVRSIGSDSRIMIGGANTIDTGGRSFKYGDFIVDEVDTWALDRSRLIAFNHIIRGINQHRWSPCIHYTLGHQEFEIIYI